MKTNHVHKQLHAICTANTKLLLVLLVVSLFISGCGGRTVGTLPAFTPTSRSAQPLPTNTNPPRPTQPSTSSVLVPPPVAILPFDYQEKLVGDGWKIAVVRLYFVNTSNKPVLPQSLRVTDISVETLEKKTYPAALLNPSSWSESSPGHREIPDDYQRQMKEGNFVWAKPENIFLGGAAVGGKLGIPPQFPFRNAPAGFGSYEYGIGFRFAEAANPVRIILQIASFGKVSLDLTVARKNIPDPSPNEVKARPLSDLTSLRLDNANIRFTWDGTCVWRIENLVRNKMIYLPYTLVNKNALDEQKVVLNFPHAVYYQRGEIHYWDDPIELKAGPGQTVRDLYLIALLISENDPMPLYLIHYDKDNNTTAFQLNCTEWKK